MKTAYAHEALKVGAKGDRKMAKKLGLSTSHQGGEVYRVPDEGLTRMTRFLILGSDTGSFYQSAQELTAENMGVVKAAFDSVGPAAVDEIARIAREGLAMKLDPIFLALAMATRHKDEAVRQAAYATIPTTCKTFSHLYTLLNYRLALGGYADGKYVGKKIPNARDPKTGKRIEERYGNKALSAGMRRALRKWLTSRSLDELAYQYIKYKQRDGISAKDVLAFAREQAKGDELRGMLYNYIVNGTFKEYVEGISHTENPWVGRLAAAAQASDPSEKDHMIPWLITQFDLPREAVRTEALNDVAVWKALLEKMPIGAMVRNLGTMTSKDVLRDSRARDRVIEKLLNEEAIRKSRIHPLSLFMAQKVYESGRSIRGDQTWFADTEIVDALGAAFMSAFKSVEPTGKDILIAVDTSMSMKSASTSVPMTSACAVSAVMALYLVATEPKTRVFSVDTAIRQLPISRHQRPVDVVRMVSEYGGGGTALSLPFEEVDDATEAIILFTDSENGDSGVRRAQEKFVKNRPDRRMVLCQTAPNAFGWTRDGWDATGKQSIEIVGFDPSIGTLLSGFLGGKF